MSATGGGQWIFHRSAEGELVLLGQAGPEANAVASSDEGRTWHDWPAVQGMSVHWPVKVKNYCCSSVSPVGKVLGAPGLIRTVLGDPRMKDRHGVAASFCLAGQSLLIRDFFGLPLPAVGS